MNVTIHREKSTDSVHVTQKKMEQSTHCRNLRGGGIFKIFLD